MAFEIAEHDRQAVMVRQPVDFFVEGLDQVVRDPGAGTELARFPAISAARRSVARRRLAATLTRTAARQATR